MTSQLNQLIRKAEPKDLDSILDIYNHYVLSTPLSFDTERQTTQMRKAWFESFFPNPKECQKTVSLCPYILLVAENSNPVGAGPAVVGYAASQPFRSKPAFDTSVETSVYCHPQHLGQGVGKALYQNLIEQLRTKPLHRAYGFITIPNDPSIRLHMRLGFKQAGVLKQSGFKFSKYWDVSIFELDLSAEDSR